MTAMQSAAHAPSAGATLKQGAAVAILGFMGIVFFSIALASIAVKGMPQLPASAAADVALLQSWLPLALLAGTAHVVAAFLAASGSSVGRLIAAVAAGATAVAFVGGAVAVAAGAQIFIKAGAPNRFAPEGIAIFGLAAVVYATVAVLIVRSRSN
jgi:hypothetical protein